MNKLQPLTMGLLVSASIRYDHSLFMPYWMDPGNHKAHIHNVISVLDKVASFYVLAATGAEIPAQILEEFDGTGFYSLQREEGYAQSLKLFDKDLYEELTKVLVAINERLQNLNEESTKPTNNPSSESGETPAI